MMIRTIPWWILGVVLACAPACSESETTDPGGGDNNGGDNGGDGTDGDNNGGDGTDGDGTDGDNNGDGTGNNNGDGTGNKDSNLGRRGDLCDVDSDCGSGLCVTIGSGKNEGLCSQRCSEDADCSDEDDWICRKLSGVAGQDVRGCTPEKLCIDKDKDGYGIGPECLGGDCDDSDPLVYNGAPEICDGKDNSCDGSVDNNPVDVGRFCDTGLEGVCNDGQTECTSGVLECLPLQQPGAEICDGIDNDCDGLIDEGPDEDENDNYIRELGGICSPDGSICANGTWVCDPVGHGGLFCDGLGDNAEEVCDGIDNNCNGQIDEGFPNLGEVCVAGEGVCLVRSVYICDPDDPRADPICAAEANLDAKEDETCNNQDDDCDGVVDNGYVHKYNASGKVDDDAPGEWIYDQTATCGSCTNDCADQWGVGTDVSSLHAEPSCVVQNLNASCGFICTGGYVDMDGRADNGCELLPDENGIYVALAPFGVTANNCGTYDRPCSTITQGIARAKDEGRKNVRVAGGVFREGVALQNGIHVLGGHSTINWSRDLAVNNTVIYGSVGAFSDDAVAVIAQNITSKTELSGVTITAPDAPEGGNSVALFIENAPELTVKDNTLQAGIGGQGLEGSAGTDGTPGQNGSNGVTGTYYSFSSCPDKKLDRPAGGQNTCNGTSVNGGAGGGSSCQSNYQTAWGKPENAELQPTAGLNNSGDFGAAGFSAYHRRYWSADNTNQCLPKEGEVQNSFSSDGFMGRTGTGGSGAKRSDAASATIIDKMWRGSKGAPGGLGTAGGGGGGGGATHSVINSEDNRGDLGPTGGGGGAGGCGGSGGTGGSAGGGSFALYLFVDGSTAPTIQNNVLIRGFGGAGGPGGLGGTGGDGGAGGAGGATGYGDDTTDYCSETGRKGGDGGRGGHGGGGGGGAGGNAYAVASKGASNSAINKILDDSGNTFVVEDPTGGSPGDGGPSMSNPGEAGASGTSGKHMTLP